MLDQIQNQKIASQSIIIFGEQQISLKIFQRNKKTGYQYYIVRRRRLILILQKDQFFFNCYYEFKKRFISIRVQLITCIFDNINPRCKSIILQKGFLLRIFFRTQNFISLLVLMKSIHFMRQNYMFYLQINWNIAQDRYICQGIICEVIMVFNKSN
ncbi:unnamed protein product [Paramecium pentaurelia]|uniref:Uncharacterized protein n=1 Tax=Paramecium pentaurelia TaxID=43138 RepID=A0A8S1WNP9_9CILI|nr:unnamed protein product [Paramecium pentaurelia]